MSQLVDEELKQFVDTYVDGLVSWAIIVFYFQNPGARDRAPDLARHLGRREIDVEKAAESLARKGLLKKEEVDGPVYVYSPSPDLGISVSKFVEAVESRPTRLWLLEQVLG